MADLNIENHGSIFLVRALSDIGREWIGDNLPEEVQKVGDAVVVEHHYIQDIAAGAIEDGLEVT
jgi:hypothetical protein